MGCIPKLRFKEFNDDWEENQLGNICKIQMGQSPSSKNYTENPKDTILIQGNADLIKGKVVPRIFTTEITKTSEPTDIIMTVRAPVGDLAINEFNACIGRGVCSIKASEFIYYLLNYVKETNLWVKFSQGSTIDAVSSKDINNLKINIPSLEEQEKIANFISKIDEKIAILEDKLLLWETYKKGIMQQLFSQKLRFKEFTDEWSNISLAEVSSNVMYGMNAAATEFDGTNKYIRITDIDDDSHRFVPLPLSSPEGKLETRFLVKNNDLLFARTGASVGKSYLYDKNDGILYFAGFLIKMNINKANSKFVYYQTLTDKYNNWVKVFSIRSGQPGINAEEYKKYSFKIPLLEEQEKIANFLTNIDEKTEKIANELRINKKFKEGLLQKMFC